MQPQLLTPVQLAQLLGVAPQTIYNRINLRGDLPLITRIGKLPRFSLSDITQWLEAKKEAPLQSKR